VAVQGGEVIFNMSASFTVPAEGPDVAVGDPPAAEPPDALPGYALPRLFAMEGRRPTQPYPHSHWPTLFWARSRVPLPADPLVHACALTYLSDIGTGLSVLESDEAAPGPSLDHALWFHRPVRLDDWVLVDLAPRTVAAGRGWYTGAVTTRDGVLAASLVQESLFRPGPNPFSRRRSDPA
jgi:acyl-CoA thioesterase-2